MRKGRISLLDEVFMTTTLKVIAEDLKARLPIPIAPDAVGEDSCIIEVGSDTPHLVRWTEFDQGGHFAAMEQPAALAGDVRAFFRQLREAATD
jgi:pimeloyl-ACP methyl ester carboxylesterase